MLSDIDVWRDGGSPESVDVPVYANNPDELHSNLCSPVKKGKSLSDFLDSPVLDSSPISDSGPSCVKKGRNLFHYFDSDEGDLQCSVFESPNGTRSWCPVVKNEYKPAEGMVFHKWEDVVSLYQSYAEKSGFSIRVSTLKKSQGAVTHRYLLCNRAGRPQRKRIFESTDLNTLNLRQTSFKVSDCKVCIKLRVCKETSVLELYSFVECHNHPLVSTYNKDLTKRGRKLDFSSKQFIHQMSLNKVGPTIAHRLQVSLMGGHHNVRGTVNDYKNFSRSIRMFIGDRDSQLVIDKLQARADHLPNFTFNYTVVDGQLRSLFWADEVAKTNYQAFGDVLAFDATYQTNKYNMIFVPFTGVDSHKKCVTFGAGLLFNETTDSYRWLLDCFVKAHGKQPSFVLTDQDPAMRQAISIVLHQSRHRLCMWHIMKKLPTKISGDLLQNTDIRSSIHKLVWNLYIEPSTFEARWEKLIVKYGLSDHAWLSDMYALRELWIPCYFRDIPLCCLMKTTSRCESSNSAFKVNSSSANTLVQFMLCFDTTIDCQRYNQRIAQYNTISTTPEFCTGLPIEKHASEIYSQTIFKEVQKEMHKGLFFCYIHSTLEDVNGTKVYNVSHLDKRSSIINDFKVEVDLTKSVSCSCMGFTRIGYLCRHIFCVLRHCKVEKIPGKYFTSRWGRDVLPSSVYNIEHRYGVDSNEQSFLRNELKEIFTQCLDRLRNDPEGLALFSEKIRALKNEVFEMFSAEPEYNKNNDVVIGDLVGQSNDLDVSCSNPQGIRNKGTGNTRRFSSPVEKAATTKKKHPQLCKTCQQYVTDHDSRNCRKIRPGVP